MRVAKLRVEKTNFNDGKTAFYGNVIYKKVVEDYHIAEFDKREDIAPCGIYATISVDVSHNNVDASHNDIDDNKVNEKEVYDIKITASYLDYEAENRYIAIFTIEDKTYEICIWFKDDKIEDVMLSEWLFIGDFEDNHDADNVYHTKDFVNFEPYYI